jgi:hypothetical protein
MTEVVFFRDALVELGRITQALWTLNLTVFLAGVGWGVTSRSWARGLSVPICVAASLTLTVFFAFNTYSLNTFYVRAGVAAEQLRSAWEREAFKGDISGIFGQVGYLVETSLGRLAPMLVGVFCAEAIAAIGVGILLSDLGRRPKS